MSSPGTACVLQVLIRPTWIGLHAGAFTLQLLRERFVAGRVNSPETVELLQL